MTEPRQIVLTDPRRWAINISLGTLSAIVGGIVLGMQFTQGWLFENFISKVSADEQTRQIETKIDEVKEIAEANAETVDELSSTFDVHVAEFRIANAIAMFDRAEEKLENYKRATGITDDHSTHDAHYDDLERRLQQAQGYLDCLLEKNNGCDPLRPRP